MGRQTDRHAIKLHKWPTADNCLAVHCLWLPTPSFCLHFAALNISESLNLCAKHFRPDCVCECEQLQLQSWLIKSILIDHFATKSICNAMRMFSIIRTISLIAWQTSSSKKTTSKSSTYAKQKGEQESKGERETRRRRMGKRSVHKALRLRAAALCWAYSQINLAALQAHWQQGQRDKGREGEGACGREREREHRTLLYL